MAEICPDCGGSYASPAELVVHMKADHKGGDAKASLDLNPSAHTPGFTCGLCGRTFARPEQLAAHSLHPHTAPQRIGRPSTS
jgi:Zinc finger, C2H2 type/C2H2-type zinc finger